MVGLSTFILFCLMNIPTIRTRSCRRNTTRGVKKWSNWTVDEGKRAILPRLAFWLFRFSKTGQGHKSKGLNSWKRYPLFKRQRLLLLVFLLFLSSFLEALGVARLGSGLYVCMGRTELTEVSTKKSIALGACSILESSRRCRPRCARRVGFGVQFGQRQRTDFSERRP